MNPFPHTRTSKVIQNQMLSLKRAREPAVPALAPTSVETDTLVPMLLDTLLHLSDDPVLLCTSAAIVARVADQLKSDACCELYRATEAAMLRRHGVLVGPSASSAGSDAHAAMMIHGKLGVHGELTYGFKALWALVKASTCTGKEVVSAASAGSGIFAVAAWQMAALNSGGGAGLRSLGFLLQWMDVVCRRPACFQALFACEGVLKQVLWLLPRRDAPAVVLCLACKVLGRAAQLSPSLRATFVAQGVVSALSQLAASSTGSMQELAVAACCMVALGAPADVLQRAVHVAPLVALLCDVRRSSVLAHDSAAALLFDVVVKARDQVLRARLAQDAALIRSLLLLTCAGCTQPASSRTRVVLRLLLLHLRPDLDNAAALATHRRKALLEHFAASAPQECCAICLASQGGQDATDCTLPCGHGFHAECLEQWWHTSGTTTCPMCRRCAEAECARLLGSRPLKPVFRSEGS